MEKLIKQYKLKKEKIDDMVIELREYGNMNEWSKNKIKRKKKELRSVHDKTLDFYNKILKGFNKSEQKTYRKAKMVLKHKIFASVIDIMNEEYINHKNENELKKYLRKNPGKKYSKSKAKDEGYKVFLVEIFK
tara:strand:+ start:816 stop:1214 length:399 start_codon:yes stop_codon:yes gene_type:complete